MSNLNNSLLTIIIPCYNAGKYFERCASSLEEVDKELVSILFVDDGSTDDTSQMIKQWVDGHKNAFFISKENGGYSTAINSGIDNCDSQYVMFLGVDDEIVSEGINKVCYLLRKNEPDILTFSTLKYYDDSREKSEIDELTQFKKEGLYSMDAFSLYKKIGKDAWILFSRDTSRCFKKTVIGETRYFGRTGVSADGCFSSIIACKAMSFEFVNEVCYYWHIHKDSVSGRKKTVEKIIEEAEVWAQFFEWVGKAFCNKKIPDPIISHFFSYKRILNILKHIGQKEIMIEHKKRSQKFVAQIKRGNCLSLKSRLKMLFPQIFEILLSIVR